jgi:Glucokinase
MAVRAKAAVLAGDIGGTKTHLGLYRVEGGSLVSLRDRLYATRDFKSLEDVARDFLSGASAIDAACFGVPGPIVDGVSHPTNVARTMEDWTLARARRAQPDAERRRPVDSSAPSSPRTDSIRCWRGFRCASRSTRPRGWWARPTAQWTCYDGGRKRAAFPRDVRSN